MTCFIQDGEEGKRLVVCSYVSQVVAKSKAELILIIKDLRIISKERTIWWNRFTKSKYSFRDLKYHFIAVIGFCGKGFNVTEHSSVA
jgi:hypothetical protein